MVKVKIGLIQIRPKIGDKKFNLDRAVAFIEDASSRGANIVVLPELFITGYDLKIIGKSIKKLSEPINGQSIKLLSKVAKRENVVVVAPIPEFKAQEDAVYNSAIVINSDGKVLGSYAKIHLWGLEKKYFRYGRECPVFRTSCCKVGVMICYDAGFPEIARILALKGAEIIVMPSAWRIQDYNLWDINTRSRALENTVFLVGVNMVYEKNGETYLFGASRIVSPDGHVIREAALGREEVIVEEVDLKNVSYIRENYRYLSDLRIELYVDEYLRIVKKKC